MIEVICSQCGATKKIPSYRATHNKTGEYFCNNTCHGIWRRLHNTKGICVQCQRPTKNKKYCSRRCCALAKKEKTVSKALRDGDAPSHAGTRRRLIEMLQGHICAICRLETWQGLPIPLVCDHIDGDASNNKLENLRLICNNCDALLPTYKGRNRGNGRQYRRERYKEGKSW